MSDKKPILTICIQTFNRSLYLKELLETVPRLDRICILVGDFSFEQEHLVQNRLLCSQRDDVKYYRGEDQGLDAGFADLVEKSTTKFCWMMPDDDLLNFQHINKVVEILSANNLDFMLINSSVYNCTYTKLLKNEIYKTPSLLTKISSDNIGEYQHALSYIGACIVKRTKWIEFLDNQYFGTYFNHVYVVANIYRSGARMFAYSAPLIRVRANNALWTEKSFQIWTENWPNALNFLHQGRVSKVKSQIKLSVLLYYYAYGALKKNDNSLSLRNRLILIFLALFNKKAVSLLIFILVSINKRSIITEPGYYILKANEGFLSDFLLGRYFNE